MPDPLSAIALFLLALPCCSSQFRSALNLHLQLQSSFSALSPIHCASLPQNPRTPILLLRNPSSAVHDHFGVAPSPTRRLLRCPCPAPPQSLCRLHFERHRLCSSISIPNKSLFNPIHPRPQPHRRCPLAKAPPCCDVLAPAPPQTLYVLLDCNRKILDQMGHPYQA